MDFKKVFHRVIPKKSVPVRASIQNEYDVQRDAYLNDLLDRLERKGKTLDSDSHRKV